jgi:hypothetical protein
MINIAVTSVLRFLILGLGLSERSVQSWRTLHPSGVPQMYMRIGSLAINENLYLGKSIRAGTQQGDYLGHAGYSHRKVLTVGL